MVNLHIGKSGGSIWVWPDDQPPCWLGRMTETMQKRLHKSGGCYKVYDVGCLPVVASWADAWEAILTALFLAKDSDRRSRCSFNLDTISLWYSCASACFCSTQHSEVSIEPLLLHTLHRQRRDTTCRCSVMAKPGLQTVTWDNAHERLHHLILFSSSHTWQEAVTASTLTLHVSQLGSTMHIRG